MLPDHYDYYYNQKQVFGCELDNIQAFVMPNYKIGMHVQEFHEINIIISGSGKHFIEENCLDATVGDIFIIPPNVRHGYLGNRGFDVFHILIHQRFIDRHSADFQTLESYFDLFSAEPIMRTKSKKPLHLRLSDERFEKVRSLLSQMEEYPDINLASDCLARSGLAMVLIPMLCKAYSESGGTIGAAGLDVFEDENGGIDSRLLNMDNLVMTPHVAWNTFEAVEAISVEVSENVGKYLTTGRPDNVVNGL